MEEFDKARAGTDDRLNATLAPLVQSAVALHEMYSAYVTAGFSKEQALQIVLTIATNAMPTKQQ